MYVCMYVSMYVMHLMYACVDRIYCTYNITCMCASYLMYTDHVSYVMLVRMHACTYVSYQVYDVCVAGACMYRI